MCHPSLSWLVERTTPTVMSPKIGADARGVLPSQMLKLAIKDGWVYNESEFGDIPDENVQPASIDLRLGNVAHRLRCSFLPDNQPVEKKLNLYSMGTIDLTGDGGILEQNRPYLVPLVEELNLPASIRGKANPKSSTGRLDVFTRIITDHSFMFDEIPAGYKGRMYLEIVPRTFTINVKHGQTLNQLRLMAGHGGLSDEEIAQLHSATPLLFRNGLPLTSNEIAISNGLFLGLHLAKGMAAPLNSKKRPLVGYRAKENSSLIRLDKVNFYSADTFWEEVYSEPGDRIVLQPEKFYLLLSQDSVRIPENYAAEMTAYDPTSGELRTHYAGFFDPGFGSDPRLEPVKGSRAALEVRAHDVPFAVEHGQNICKLSFERMLEVPDRLYGHALESNYQGQEIALSKHFQRDYQRRLPQSSLFE
jgi:dCTP deaminase